ncbi:MAG: GFA family protein [Pseudomonadota bacterium]
MRLEGSCHCGKVTFSVDSITPYPYQKCYCSICRKTAGGGGFAINIMGWTDSLEIKGDEHISIYHAHTEKGVSEMERRFCSHCGSALWVYSDRWPDLMHPFASAIDTPLPAPPEQVHMMLEFKPDWVSVPDAGPSHVHFAGYPSKSIESWHGGLSERDKIK